MLMGSKFLIKMTRPQNITIKNSVLQPGHLYQQVDILISKNQALQIYLKHHDNVYKTP